MAPKTRGLSCQSCAAALLRCWVCGEGTRCAGCQLCLQCEGLLIGTEGRVRVTAPAVRVPSVRFRRPRAEARPRPAPPSPAPSRSPEFSTATPPGRVRARRVVSRRAATAAPELGDVVWYVRAAVVPALMLLATYLCYGYVREWSGLALAAGCLFAFYLPYVILTPVRRKGDFFPLGDEGPGLPIVMVIGGALVGGICGIVLGLFGGERVGVWGGGVVAVITFHAIYYGTVAEKSRADK